MRTLFASHNGGVVSTAVVPAHEGRVGAEAKRTAPCVPVRGSAVGGQLGRITAAIGQVGWNEYRVPVGERGAT